MKKILAAVYCSIVLFPMMCATAEDGEPKPLKSHITEVTVYSDRARISRAATAPLGQGNLEYAFTGLPGWIDESSVRVSLLGTSSGRITDVRTVRKYLARAGSKTIRDAEDAAQEIADQITELDAELRVLNEKEKQIAGVRAFSMDKLPRDTALRDMKIESYAAVVDFVSDSLLKTAKAKLAINRKRRELMREQQARQKKLNELRQRTSLEECSVVVRIEAKRASASNLELVYMLPGATWEAVHELRAKGDLPKSVALASYAVVTQTTGEDWNGAKISFSTQSPTKTAQIPELDALLLGNSQAAMRVAQAQTRTFNEALQRYQGQNTLWYAANNPDQSIVDYNSNWRSQQMVATRFIRVARVLEQRGTTAHFQGEGNPTVRGNGDPVRVQIGSVSLDATSDIVAAPRASLNAASVVKMTNLSAQPLLPGRLSLYRDGAFLGITETEFVAQGEPFSVFLGVADQVKLARILDKKRSSLVRGKKSRLQAVFEISVENLADKEITVSLADRIPVSQRNDIRVYRVDIDPKVEPDSKGLLKWKVPLKPGEKKIFSVGYTVEYPQEVLEIHKASKARGKLQSAPSDDMLQEIEDSVEMM